MIPPTAPTGRDVYFLIIEAGPIFSPCSWNILDSVPAGRNIYADGFEYTGEPIMLTEFGGIGYDKIRPDGWGYTVASSEAEFIHDLERVFDALRKSKVLTGFCYTQFTDVEQEINGLLTYEREPKCDLEIIKNIVEK